MEGGGGEKKKMNWIFFSKKKSDKRRFCKRVETPKSQNWNDLKKKKRRRYVCSLLLRFVNVYKVRRQPRRQRPWTSWLRSSADSRQGTKGCRNSDPLRWQPRAVYRPTHLTVGCLEMQKLRLPQPRAVKGLARCISRCGTADAEIKVPPAENPQLWKAPRFLRWDIKRAEMNLLKGFLCWEPRATKALSTPRLGTADADLVVSHQLALHSYM